MTNTRITDIEILERRYPVYVRKFMLRPGTGGRGKFTGGDGVLREILFRSAVTLSVLTERRVLQPYGLKGIFFVVGHNIIIGDIGTVSVVVIAVAGGECGARGLNLLIRNDGRTINLGPKTAVPVLPGVSCIIKCFVVNVSFPGTFASHWEVYNFCFL